MQKSGLGVQAHGSACVCLRAVYKHVFTKLEGEAIIHLPGILATAIPRKGSASWSGDESAEGLWGRSHSATGLASPYSGKVSRPRLAWLLCLGHCFGSGCREHIPGTGQHRRPEGFPSSSFSFPPLAPVPPHTRPFIFPSCSRTKTPCSLALELEPNGKRREVGHESCQAQAGQGMRTPPASSPEPSEGVLCSALPPSIRAKGHCPGLLGTGVQGEGCRGGVTVFQSPVAEPEVANVAGDTGQRNRKEDST